VTALIIIFHNLSVLSVAVWQFVCYDGLSKCVGKQHSILGDKRQVRQEREDSFHW